MIIPEQAVEAAAREIAEMVRDCANTFFPKQVATTSQTDTLTLGFANLIRKHLTAAQPLMVVQRPEDVARDAAFEKLRTAYQDMEAMCATYQAAAKIDLTTLDADCRELALWAACEAGRRLDTRAGGGPSDSFGRRLEKIAGILTLPHTGQPPFLRGDALRDQLRGSDVLRAEAEVNGETQEQALERFVAIADRAHAGQPQEGARVDELDKAEWREVTKLLRPDWTEEQFEEAWREFVEFKRRKAMQ